ncbi:MAG: adenylate/guanylate cyclase domain-containing protein, partial [Myxococcales bacterium]
IESLTSGVMVVEARTKHITLYSRRMEEILGVPAEQMLGRDVVSAFAGASGIDPSALVQTVQGFGRLPLTKLRVVMPGGRALWLYVSATRLRGPGGEPEGTVVVVDDVTERELLIDSFSRYVSRDLVGKLLARAESPKLGGERHSCTILFADLRGFTAIAERQTPEELQELLNGYFRIVIAAIARHGGFIDKFIGDKVMALFTAPAGPAESAAAAVRAASLIRAQLKEYAAALQVRGQPPLVAGIGINSGEVLLGNIGTEERMDFTAIGDAVNVADRLEGLARPGQILVGEASAALVKGVPLTSLGMRQVKGREAAIGVYELAESA